MTAYVSQDRGVCIALTLDVPGPNDLGGAGCGYELRGEPNLLTTRQEAKRHWVAYVYSAPGLYNLPPFLYGPVADGVERVDVVLVDGKTVEAAIQRRDDVSVAVDFYITELPRDVGVEAVVARDAAGTVLERRVLRLPVVRNGRVLLPAQP
jgi:hypothetical protein